MTRPLTPDLDIVGAGKRAASSFYAPALFSPRTRRIVGFMARFG